MMEWAWRSITDRDCTAVCAASDLHLVFGSHGREAAVPSGRLRPDRRSSWKREIVGV